MLDLATFKWRRTAFTRIDGAVEIAEDDWSLTIDGLQAARIYRVRGGPHDGPMVLGRSDWPSGSAGELRGDLAGDERHLKRKNTVRGCVIPRLVENPGEFPCILRLNGFG
jgi:hypothetical protein